jgi:hypothetical protein
MRCSTLLAILLSSVLAAGCGDGDETTTQAELTWKATIADNITPDGQDQSREIEIDEQAGPIPDDVTYTSGSGTVYYLVFKPPGWSSGGTGGSNNIGDVKWRSWTRTSALGVGTVGLRGPCVTASANPGPSCTGQNAYYQAPGRIRLDMPDTCKSPGGVTLRYFSRYRFEFFARAENPFGEPEGWATRTGRLRDHGFPCGVNLER